MTKERPESSSKGGEARVVGMRRGMFFSRRRRGQATDMGGIGDSGLDGEKRRTRINKTERRRRSRRLEGEAGGRRELGVVNNRELLRQSLVGSREDGEKGRVEFELID